MDFSDSTAIHTHESLCPYYHGIWNRCTQSAALFAFTKLKMALWNKLHISDLKNIFPDVGVDNFKG